MNNSIKKYKLKKSLLILLVFAISGLIYVYKSQDIFPFILLGIIFIISLGQSKLLFNIINEENFYIFETYSIITQKEKFKIEKSKLLEIGLHKNSTELAIKFQGTNGPVKRVFETTTTTGSELIYQIETIKNHTLK